MEILVLQERDLIKKFKTLRKEAQDMLSSLLPLNEPVQHKMQRMLVL